MLVKHYKTEAEAQANCGPDQEVIEEGNANRRYRIITKAEANAERDRAQERYRWEHETCTPPAYWY